MYNIVYVWFHQENSRLWVVSAPFFFIGRLSYIFFFNLLFFCSMVKKEHRKYILSVQDADSSNWSHKWFYERLVRVCVFLPCVIFCKIRELSAKSDETIWNLMTIWKPFPRLCRRRPMDSIYRRKILLSVFVFDFLLPIFPIYRCRTYFHLLSISLRWRKNDEHQPYVSDTSSAP